MSPSSVHCSPLPGHHRCQGAAAILSQLGIVKEPASLWSTLMEHTRAGVGASQPDCGFRLVPSQNCRMCYSNDSGDCLHSLGPPSSIPSLSRQDQHLPCRALLGLGQGLVSARSQGSPVIWSRRTQSFVTRSVWILLQVCYAETLRRTKLLVGKTFSDVIGTCQNCNNTT